MSEDEKRHDGQKHVGAPRSSPYPVSRLAPVHDLVDVAREIAQAHSLVSTVASSKLQVIATQIEALQAQARAILHKARQDARLHEARCNFSKRPGHTYHLYEKPSGESYLSLLSPEDWNGQPPDTFRGSYRLEADLSWTSADEPRDLPDPAVLHKLLDAAGEPT